MKYYDVSMPIHSGMAVWKNNSDRQPAFVVERDFNADGTGSRLTRVTLDMHTGTHVDAPLHFIAGGHSIDQVALGQLIRPVRVLDLTYVQDKITRAELDGLHINPGDFLLFKTRNSFADEFDPDFVYLDHTGAEYLVEREAAGVGIDALGVERSQADHATHILLLGSGLVIIEGLRLGEVPPGAYFMVAAPLRFQGVEAAPARVLLFGAEC